MLFIKRAKKCQTVQSENGLHCPWRTVCAKIDGNLEAILRCGILESSHFYNLK